jgi:hypothetical protein
MIIRLSEIDINVLKSYGIDEGEYSIEILPTESDFVFPVENGPKIKILKKNGTYFIELPDEVKPAYTGHTVDLIPGEEMGYPEKIRAIFV